MMENQALDGLQTGPEIWRAIKGAPGYEVSNYGRVRHEWRPNTLQHYSGKAFAFLSVNGTQVAFPVEQLIADAFANRIPGKLKSKKKAKKAAKAAKIKRIIEGRRDAWAVSRKCYRNATAYIPNDGRHREPGNFKVLRNFAATVIDGWFDEPESQFKAHHIRTISICRDHWQALDEAAYERRTKRGFIPTKAYMATLRRVQGMACRVPLWQWRIFENVVRWDEPTGIPGSKFSKIAPASVDAAKRIVAEVAKSIA